MESDLNSVEETLIISFWLKFPKYITVLFQERGLHLCETFDSLNSLEQIHGRQLMVPAPIT